MKTSAKEIGHFLEQKAKIGEPINYQVVIDRFPDLPPLTGNWKSHPLCSMFGDLDGEDHRNNLPFRTSLVYAKNLGRPGQGFFETVSRLRGKTILKQEQDKVWIAELDALRAHYK
jgi:hypothetical protein